MFFCNSNITLSFRHGIVHFDTIKDASIFYYGMQGNHDGPRNIMIKFSAAFKFGTREEISYPKFENSTSTPVTPPANVKSSVIDLTENEDEGTVGKKRKMVFYFIEYYYFNDSSI